MRGDLPDADMVLFCGSYEEMYVPKSTDQPVKIGEAAKTRDDVTPLIDDLAHGKAPAWLKRVHFPLLGGEVLYDVVPEQQQLTPAP